MPKPEEPLPEEPWPKTDRHSADAKAEYLSSLRSAVGRKEELKSRLPIVQDNFDQFVHALSDANSDRPVYCAAGCDSCCHHWVHQVQGFEIEFLAQLILEKGTRAVTISKLRDLCQSYEDVLEAWLEDNPQPVRGELDHHALEAVALAYWRLRKPCVFLEEDGRCGVYAARPLTCRSFLSLGPAHLCTPDAVQQGKGRTFLADPGEQAWHHQAQLSQALGYEAEDGYEFFPALLERLERGQ